jgi:hypothetical protein
MRVYTLSVRNRFLATLALLGLIGLGAAVVFVGFTLFLGLAAAGTVVGAGMSIYNRIRGRSADALPRATTLDPQLEVFPARTTNALPAAPETNRDTRDST